MYLAGALMEHFTEGSASLRKLTQKKGFVFVTLVINRLFMSCLRSAIKEVNDWAPSLSAFNVILRIIGLILDILLFAFDL